jgi:hypothetical protein
MTEESQTATIETGDGTSNVVSLPALRQVIQNPDGSVGQPVPLDGDALIIQTASGQVSLAFSEVERIEQVDDEYRFQTVDGQFVGEPVVTGISRLVLTGFVSDRPVASHLTSFRVSSGQSSHDRNTYATSRIMLSMRRMYGSGGCRNVVTYGWMATPRSRFGQSPRLPRSGNRGGERRK